MKIFHVQKLTNNIVVRGALKKEGAPVVTVGELSRMCQSTEVL